MRNKHKVICVQINSITIIGVRFTSNKAKLIDSGETLIVECGLWKKGSKFHCYNYKYNTNHYVYINSDVRQGDLQKNVALTTKIKAIDMDKDVTAMVNLGTTFKKTGAPQYGAVNDCADYITASDVKEDFIFHSYAEPQNAKAFMNAMKQKVPDLARKDNINIEERYVVAEKNNKTAYPKLKSLVENELKKKETNVNKDITDKALYAKFFESKE